jgi:hypothetical protein
LARLLIRWADEEGPQRLLGRGRLFGDIGEALGVTADKRPKVLGCRDNMAGVAIVEGKLPAGLGVSAVRALLCRRASGERAKQCQPRNPEIPSAHL